MSEGLKLLARSHDDLAVLSACLQDAVLKRGDIAMLPEHAMFVALANRYVWEDAESQLRIRTGIRFRNVTRVQHKAIPDDPTYLLYLLAIQYDSDKHQICLVFAEKAEIRLDVEDCEVILEDIGAPWSARRKPSHD